MSFSLSFYLSLYIKGDIKRGEYPVGNSVDDIGKRFFISLISSRSFVFFFFFLLLLLLLQFQLVDGRRLGERDLFGERCVSNVKS